MKFEKDKTNFEFKGRTLGEKLLNPNVNQYRLTKKQRIFYTELFNENASNGKVKRENFFPLLGILGTQIAQEFSDRMFLVLSKGKQEITLDQYLHYIDTYFYGDIHERCLYTCKLIDIQQKGYIELKDLSSYINLIINTVKKVDNTLTKTDLMSEKDIEILFYHISKGKSSFSYEDFENIYREKPELVSWFDYFKNDKGDILLIIHENMEIILKEIYSFLCSFMNDIFLLLDNEKEINLELIFQNVLNYNSKIEKVISNFISRISKFKITSVFSKVNAQNYLRIKFIYDLQNKIFEYYQKNTVTIDERKNVNELFQNIKKYLYKKDDKEILLNDEGKNNINNRWDKLAEKFLKRSRLFRDKNFKFIDIKDLKEKISDLSKAKNDSIFDLNNSSIQNLSNFNTPTKSININNNNINYSPFNTPPPKIKNLYNPHKNIIINNNYNINNYNINNNYSNDSNDINSKNNFVNLDYKPPLHNSFQNLEENQKLKQLLFFSRVVIEKALEANIMFNNCYKWISENYLSKYINKIKKEEKLKKNRLLKRKNSKVNKPRKIVPLKKKIIGTSEKSFEILFNMIMGIQIAVQAIPNFKIIDKQDIKKYLTKMIYSIQTVYLGNEKEETYLLKEFGGVIFNNIRLLFGITKENFIKSISPQDFITELMISSQTIFEELCSTGKSGSLLYYTRDGEFIVKTISRKEYRFLKNMIGDYYFYIRDNPTTFLPKLYGCYVLQRKSKKKITNIYFIVMTNVFATTHNIDIRFDLKGSRIGRSVLKGKAIDKEIFRNGDMALKDLDFEKFDEKVNIGKKREIILEQFKKDIDFLEVINSNDYSLLLGIHFMKNSDKLDLLKSTTIKTNNEEKKDDKFSQSLFSNTYETDSNNTFINENVNRLNNYKTIFDLDDLGILSKNKKRIYYFGIIDILTEYGCQKHLEYFFKRIIYCSDNMSCIPPSDYKMRFFNYLKTIFVDEENEDNNQNLTNKDNINIGNKYIFDKFGSQMKDEYQNNNIEESIQNL